MQVANLFVYGVTDLCREIDRGWANGDSFAQVKFDSCPRTRRAAGRLASRSLGKPDEIKHKWFVYGQLERAQRAKCDESGQRLKHQKKLFLDKQSPFVAFYGHFFRNRSRKALIHGHAARDPVQSGHRPGSVQARAPPGCRRAPAQALRRRLHLQSGRAGRVGGAAPLARHRRPSAARRRDLAPLSVRRPASGRQAACHTRQDAPQA